MKRLFLVVFVPIIGFSLSCASVKDMVSPAAATFTKPAISLPAFTVVTPPVLPANPPNPSATATIIAVPTPTPSLVFINPSIPLKPIIINVPNPIVGAWIGVNNHAARINFYADMTFKYILGYLLADNDTYAYNPYTGIGSMVLFDKIKPFTVTGDTLTFDDSSIQPFKRAI